jgi:hypothetical protein
VDLKGFSKRISEMSTEEDDLENLFDDLINGEDFEQDILDDAYYNTYLVLTNKITIDELLKENEDNEDTLFLPFDPTAPETIELIIGDTIKYFEELEDYEKCAELMQTIEQNKE